MADVLHAGVRIKEYRLVRPLGAGGMAEVWLARREGAAGFSRDVAVKFLLGLAALDENKQRWFRNEGLLGGRLTHPNVVQAFDFVDLVKELGPDWQERRFALVMEYIDGVNLEELLARQRAREDSIPEDIVLQLLLGAARGLQAAHEARDEDGRPLGVVHRDLKPGNLLLAWSGMVKVADFGIARIEASGQRTSADLLAGTMAYVSPEHAGGEVALDARADVFSLGLIFYELLALEPFHRFEGLSRLEQFRRACAPDVRGRLATLAERGVPTRLLAVLEACLEVDRERRIPSMRVLARRLEQLRAEAGGPISLEDWLGGFHPEPDRQPTDVRPRPSRSQMREITSGTRSIPETAPVRRPGGRRSWLLAGLVGVGIVLLAAGWWVGWPPSASTAPERGGAGGATNALEHASTPSGGASPASPPPAALPPGAALPIPAPTPAPTPAVATRPPRTRRPPPPGPATSTSPPARPRPAHIASFVVCPPSRVNNVSVAGKSMKKAPRSGLEVLSGPVEIEVSCSDPAGNAHFDHTVGEGETLHFLWDCTQGGDVRAALRQGDAPLSCPASQ